MDAHAADGHAHADIDRHVRGYMIVFATLLVATVLTVAVSYLHLPTGAAIGLALVIATFKASLVGLFFMHLITERSLIYTVLAFTIFFFLVLLLLPVFTNLDDITIRV